VVHRAIERLPGASVGGGGRRARLGLARAQPPVTAVTLHPSPVSLAVRCSPSAGWLASADHLSRVSRRRAPSTGTLVPLASLSSQRRRRRSSASALCARVLGAHARTQAGDATARASNIWGSPGLSVGLFLSSPWAGRYKDDIQVGCTHSAAPQRCPLWLAVVGRSVAPQSVVHL
jgi:hypothetical protein